jgi:hypothetical protein
MTQNDENSKAAIEELINENLKRVYSDLVQEELPDKFKDLLDLLKAQDVESSPDK